MENIMKIEARRFPVTVFRGTATELDYVVITKDQLRALDLVGKSSVNMIRAMYGRRGIEVIDIGPAEKKTLTIDVTKLWESGDG